MLHPIVAAMLPNEEQAPAIQARGRDVIVTAGAGTGKTRTLVARYLALLAEGLPVRSVVAVTFTRKAAHEMRNRVREAVRRYLSQPDVVGDERARWEALHSQLDAARIGTIHTLCAEILRAHPVEAAACAEAQGASPWRIDPGFDVLDEAQVVLLQEQAVDLALTWAAGLDDGASLFALAHEHALREGLLRMVRSRLAVADCRPDWANPSWADWEARLTAPIQRFVADPHVCECLSELGALRADGTLDRAAAAGDALAEPLRTLLDLWDVILAARDAGDWERVSACLKPLRDAVAGNKGRKANWAPAQPKETVADLRRLYDASLALLVGSGLDLGLDRRLMAAMPALARLHARAVAAYGALKAERRALDFDDLEQGALILLQADAGVRRLWQEELRALLVDEFQDTDTRQRDLLRLLNRPEGKLFMVGDAKQSIYAFRGADVTVFRRERADVAQQGGYVLSLVTSYRAHSALVEGLNALLCPVLGTEADPCRAWAEPFTPLNAHRQDPAHGLKAPHIEFHLTAGTKADGALERAADALAERLRALVDGQPADLAHGAGRVGAEGTGTRVEGGDGQRRLGYGDVAILCRASTSFAPYEDALDQAGIPYITVAGRGFYERPEVRDMLNLLRALADPDDDLALAGALRSPVMGLSDAALYRLCDEQQRRGEGAALWDALADAARASSDGPLPDEAPRARAALERLTQLRKLVGRTTVADLIKALYDDTGYPAALTAVGQWRGSRNLAKLLDDAHRSGLVGVGEFLEYVTRLRDVGAREGEARALSEGAVQIMSVHAAKGLEFPVVVIGDITHRGSARDAVTIDPELGPLLQVHDDGGHAPLAVRLAGERLRDQEAAESARLFYVAATRARELLILSGCVSLKNGETLTGLGEWLSPVVESGATDLGEVAWDYDVEGATVRRQEIHIGAAPAACCLYEPRWHPEAAPRVAPADGAGARALHSDRHPESGGVPWRRESGHFAYARGDDVEKPGGDAGRRLPNPAMLDSVSIPATTVDERTGEHERHPPRRVWRVVPEADERKVPPWLVGNIVHEAVATWRFGDDDFQAWAEARAQHYGLTDRARIDNASVRAYRLVQRLRGHPLYEEMASATPRWHEVPYSLERNGRLEVGILDVVYRRADGWTIVDIKTDHLKSVATVQDWIERYGYAEQMARYRRAVKALLGETPRARLCFLDVAGAVHLVEIDK